MEPTVSLMVAIAAMVILITLYGIYVAFGPPSKDLDDPYEMHED